MRLEKEKIIAACQPSLLSCVHITPETDTVPGPTDSKFGGDYYLPAGAEPPNMELLAQINLAQVPHRKGFPERGLLQFFLCTDDAVVEDRVYDEFVWQNDAGIFQVMYYPEVQENQPPQKEIIPQERWFKKKVTSGMRFKPAEEIATIAFNEEGGFLIDLGFESLADTLMPVFRAAWAGDEEEDDEDAAGEGVYNLSDYGDIDQFCRDFGNWGFKLGGHPALRQAEFRLDEEAYQAYTVLLFQYDLTVLNSKDPMALEKDTFCFFIKPEDLNACRFDDILMVHHNCY